MNKKIFYFITALGLCSCVAKNSTREIYSGSVVRFGFASDRVSNFQRENLVAIVSYMEKNPRAVLVLEGRTDPIGNSEYNLDLGDRRARQVKADLMGEGIQPERLVVTTQGESKNEMDNNLSYAERRRVIVKDVRE